MENGNGRPNGSGLWRVDLRGLGAFVVPRRLITDAVPALRRAAAIVRTRHRGAGFCQRNRG